MGTQHRDSRHPYLRLAGGALVSLGISGAVLASAWSTESLLGAPVYWTWLLTGMQVVALWSAGTSRWWGWLLGAAVQPPWITYAAVTGQFGFIPGCLFSVAVQSYSFLRKEQVRPSRLPRPAPRPGLGRDGAYGMAGFR